MVYRNSTPPASTARSFFREVTGSLLSIAFPSACSLCQQELTGISLTGVCADCWDSLEAWSGPACPSCGLPFASDQTLESADSRCGDCRAGEFAFDRARSFGLYRDSLRAVILQLKFHHRERLGTRLGALLAPAWELMIGSSEKSEVFVVPVPLHSGRARERGYNQSELLSRGLVRALAQSRQGPVVKMDRRILRKTRATPPQTGLTYAERRENVRGAFAVVSPGRVRDRVVVLLDDVMTTGATLSACAEALKRAGAQRVLALTLARATPQFPDSARARGAAEVDDFGPGRP